MVRRGCVSLSLDKSGCPTSADISGAVVAQAYNQQSRVRVQDCASVPWARLFPIVSLGKIKDCLVRAAVLAMVRHQTQMF